MAPGGETSPRASAERGHTTASSGPAIPAWDCPRLGRHSNLFRVRWGHLHYATADTNDKEAGSVEMFDSQVPISQQCLEPDFSCPSTGWDQLAEEQHCREQPGVLVDNQLIVGRQRVLAAMNANCTQACTASDYSPLPSTTNQVDRAIHPTPVAKRTSPTACAADPSTQKGSVTLDPRSSHLVINSPYRPSTEIFRYQENSSCFYSKACLVKQGNNPSPFVGSYYPQVLFHRGVLHPFIPQSVLIVGIALTQVQDLGLGLAEHHEVHMGPLLQPVKGPLDGIPSLQCIDCTTQLGVIHKLAEGALNPTRYIIDEYTKLVLVPIQTLEGHHSLLVSIWTLSHWL
ncbi:hypothetical protein QYF61_015789 [Mycteria americana]|uniref:Uncharacterized protein n=1 Tax=Mycteria americana TaxID=33587 RepID=A0AAN7S6L2_MYCAM|nr:hypothetical protein QYF61_015789 [Mycteria americana]